MTKEQNIPAKFVPAQAGNGTHSSQACFGILLAAGSGVRLGAPKALLPLDGKPMLEYSLNTFQQAPGIHGIVVVCRNEELEQIKILGKSASISKLKAIVPGGKERQDSVQNGLSALPQNAEIVAVHDSARPLASVKLLESVLQTAFKKGAAVPSLPVQDTIKQVHDGRVEKTLHRQSLQTVQTPQAFRVDLLKKALMQATLNNFYGTDCASLVEQIGHPVYLVPGEPSNMKITTSSDLHLAEALLSKKHV